MSLKAEDVQCLADALSLLKPTTSTASVAATSVKLPTFWKQEPVLWFAQVEALFSSKGITQDQTKYDYVVAALDSSTILEIKPTIVSPPTKDRYSSLKTALKDAFDRPQCAKDAELLSITEIGDRTPTSHLRYLRSLNSDGSTLLQACFLSHLPADIRAIVTAQGLADVDQMAKAADRALQARDAAQPTPTASAIRHRGQRTNTRRDSRADKTERSDRRERNFICFYHRRFGKQANRCQPDCIFADQPAAHQIDASGNDDTDRQ